MKYSAESFNTATKAEARLCLKKKYTMHNIPPVI